MRAASIAVTRVARVGEVLDVTVSVHSELVGHYFPALETKLRYGWIVLEALDAGGKVLASTPPPPTSRSPAIPVPAAIKACG